MHYYSIITAINDQAPKRGLNLRRQCLAVVLKTHLAASGTRLIVVVFLPKCYGTSPTAVAIDVAIHSD